MRKPGTFMRPLSFLYAPFMALSKLSASISTWSMAVLFSFFSTFLTIMGSDSSYAFIAEIFSLTKHGSGIIADCRGKSNGYMEILRTKSGLNMSQSAETSRNEVPFSSP